MNSTNDYEAATTMVLNGSPVGLMIDRTSSWANRNRHAPFSQIFSLFYAALGLEFRCSVTWPISTTLIKEVSAHHYFCRNGFGESILLGCFPHGAGLFAIHKLFCLKPFHETRSPNSTSPLVPMLALHLRPNLWLQCSKLARS